MTETQTIRLDALVVGAGFAGLYALHKVRGLGFQVQAVEAGSGVGGTWFWNRYPGARCDCQSQVYSYTFDESLQREWQWSERYATQPEIMRYLNFVTDRLDLRKDINFSAKVVEAAYDDASGRWTVSTDNGLTFDVAHLVLATGALSVGRLPNIKGRDSFAGEAYHTSSWPEGGVDFTGRRVAVIGTGSSGVQAIPLIAAEAEHLTVFQRTPAYVAPARNTSLTDTEMARFQADLPSFRAALRAGRLVGNGDLIIADHLLPPQPSALAFSEEECRAILEARWAVGGMSVLHAFSDVMTDMQANARLGDFVRDKIRASIEDPSKAEALTPTRYAILTKRMCVGTDYFEAFNRENVDLVDLSKTPIEEITPTGLRTTDGDYSFDTLVFATGFDALTGSLVSMNIQGRGGRMLNEDWAHGPHSFLGIAIHGYPNLFTLNGPGSPGILGNNVVGIEQHVEWLADLLVWARERGVATLEPTTVADADWTAHVRDVGKSCILSKGDGWYVKREGPGDAGVFVPYAGAFADYCARCDEIASNGYADFALTFSRQMEPDHAAR